MGLLLGLLLGMGGIVVALILYLLFFTPSVLILVVIVTVGAGVGAGVASVAAGLRLEGTSRASLIVAMLIGLAAGSAGGWGGFQLGLYQQEAASGESPGSTPDFNLMSSTAFGASIAANVAALLLGVAKEIGRRKAPIRPGIPGYRPLSSNEPDDHSPNRPEANSPPVRNRS